METIVNRMALSTTRAATRLKPVSPRNRSINSTTKIASITPSRKAISNLLAGTMSSSLPGEAWRTSSIPDRAGRAAHRTTKSWVGPDSSPIVTATSGMQLASHPKSLRLGAHAATVVDVLITSSPDWIARTALAMGYSGVRRILVTRLLDFLNRGVHPVIPSRGSLGASGDLAPLAHLGLVLVGEGEAEVAGQILPGAKALVEAKLAPLVLQSKEGLAIINGTSVMAAVGAIVVNDGLPLLKDAQVAASMSFEALRGSPKPFDDRLVGLKPQPGAREIAANVRRLLRGSEVIPSHKGPHKVQDPYMLRCIPEVLGAVRATLQNAAASLRIEMNAATDNPLIFPEGTSVSGGNFHAQALAMALDHVALGMAVLAGFSERRIARLVDTRLSELPPF